VDERLERIAKNEVVFRATNRELEAAQQEVGGGTDQPLEVLCECGRPSCSGIVTLTVGEFERVHSHDDRFVVLRGHESPEIERVVEEHGDYLVVDKFGEAEEIAEDEPG
jgi:hypothetical protein